MTVERTTAEQTHLESDLWEVLERTRGTESRETSEFIYRWARRTEGIVLLERPSLRAAVAAALGTLASGSPSGPVRVYLADSSREALLRLFSELSELDLATDVTLYHGSISQFALDLPVRIALMCVDDTCGDVSAGRLRSILTADSVFLVSNAAQGANLKPAEGWLDTGVLETEVMGADCAVYRATRLCHGPRFVPRTGLRVALQGRLHERYFFAENSGGALHTPVADLTADIRREFAQQFVLINGSGQWPFAAPESPPLPPTLPSGKPWPKVSIVTPTRNQGRYLEETILSVLHQNYPSVEHIVVDGASTDETPAILARYRERLAVVISEPDGGQSQAINKGMSRASGHILTWLNGDDMLAPGALAAVALAADLSGADMIAGVCRLCREGSIESQHLTSCAPGPLPLDLLLDLDQSWHAGRFFIQPEVMFTREIWLRAGACVDERLTYAMDYELWLRFARAKASLHVIGREVAWFRLHAGQKISARANVARELTECRDRFAKVNGIRFRTRVRRSPWLEKLRIALVHEGPRIPDCREDLGIHRALEAAGHEVRPVAVDLREQDESLIRRVSAIDPHLVIVGRAVANGLSSRVAGEIAKRFRTLPGNWPSFSRDLWRPCNKVACREHLGLPVDRFLVLINPSSDDAHQALALLEAIAQLRMPDCSVVLQGTLPEVGCKSIALIEMRGGSDPRAAALLKCAVDVVVASISVEGASQSLIEALACGTAAVGYTADAAVRAMWEKAPGVLLSECDPASIAAAIHRLHAQPLLRNDQGVWGRMHAENEWTEFSAYRHIFLALEKSGLRESLNLRPRIEFTPQSARR